MKINKCLNCGIEINRLAKRCMKCANIRKSEIQSGKNNPAYKDGRSLKLNYCLDCGKQIKWDSKRCIKCNAVIFGKKHNGKNNPFFGKYHTEKSKLKMGKIRNGIENPAYIDGRTLIKNYCIDCGIKLKGNSKRCVKCNNIFFGNTHSGKNSSTWQGGLSFYPYNEKWNYKLKEEIKKRDNYICQVCGKKQIGRNLDVHHINYSKTNCRKSNLITLCNSCHTKTNYNRSFWYAYFKYIQIKVK